MALTDLIEKVLTFEGVGDEGRRLAKRLKESVTDESSAGLMNRLLDHIEAKGKEE